MNLTNNDLSVKWGSITFPSEFIDITTYKPSTKKITSSDSGRSKVTGYMVFSVVAIKETLDFTLKGLSDETLASIKEYAIKTKNAKCTYPAAKTGGPTKTCNMYIGSDLNEEIQCVEPDGSIIWQLPISLVEM